MDGKPLIEEGKNKEAQWAALCAVFLAVMEKLNSGKSPCIWVSTDSWAVSTGLALGSGRWAMGKAGPLRNACRGRGSLDITPGI